MIPFVLSSSGTISAFVNGRHYNVGTEHPAYNQLCECLKTGDSDGFVSFVDTKKAIATTGNGNVTVEGDTVNYKGRPVHPVLQKYVMDIIRGGFDVAPVYKFIENLMLNPSKRAVEATYSFLSLKGFPLTEDGCFLGYKSVDENDMDIYSGTTRNAVGDHVECDRNLVDDNWEKECSSGYHVGTIDYASSYGGGLNIKLVKVNPKDVVSIPSDASARKLRVCAYDVVSNYTNQNVPITAPVASPDKPEEFYVDSSLRRPPIKTVTVQLRDANGRFTGKSKTYTVWQGDTP